MAETAGDRLRRARQEAGWATAADAARATKMHAQNWANHEAGTRGIREKNAKEYAAAFKVGKAPFQLDWLWLLTGHGAGQMRTLQVVGYLGAGAQVHALGAHETSIPAPIGAHEGDVAFEIRDDSMLPFRAGGFIVARPLPHVADALGYLAVVSMADGTRWFKQVLPSDAPGRYTLLSLQPGSAPILNAELASAARFRVYVEPD